MRTALVVGLTCCFGLTASAQTDTAALSNRIDSLQQAVTALSKEINELSSLLRIVLPPSPVADIAPAELDIAKAAVRGRSTAKVVLIEFTDFECPFCSQHSRTSFVDIQRQFVESGQIQYVVRNLPLEGLHAHAFKAAEAAECAKEQGKYWEMHDRLFAKQQALSTADLLTYAKDLELNVEEFQACLTEGKTTPIVREDLSEAQRFGLTGTPAFLVGEMRPNGRVLVTKKLTGAQPFPIFDATLRTAVERQ